MQDKKEHIISWNVGSRFPSKKVFIITWAVLISYLTIDFMLNGNKTFGQLNYDWGEIEILDVRKDVKVDSLSYDYLVLENSFDNIKTFTNNVSYGLKNQHTSYFRASSINITDKLITFSGVKWINRIPSKEIKSGTLQIVDLPILQSGEKEIITIGDSQILWREGRDFRKNLLNKNSLVFLGSQKDVYGYPHEAQMYATAEDILKRLPKIQKAPFYLLFFGAHDKATDSEELSIQVCKILQDLNQRQETEGIIAITLPPSPNKSFEKYNVKFNEILKECSKSYKKVEVVDLYIRLKNESSYLLDDQVHLNENGYYILTKLLRTHL